MVRREYRQFRRRAVDGVAERLRLYPVGSVSLRIRENTAVLPYGTQPGSNISRLRILNGRRSAADSPFSWSDALVTTSMRLAEGTLHTIGKT